MKVKAIVPIKLNNERLPGKNTKMLGGKPLIKHILESLDKSEKIDEIYVYCSDEEIKNYMIETEKVKFLKRPKYLDEKTSNFTQIFTEFSNTIDSDIYVYAHATAPYITTETIDKCIENVLSGYDSSFTAEKIQDYLWQEGEPLNFDATNLPRSQDLDPIYRETSGVYVFTKEVFKNYKRRIGVNPKAVEVSFKESIDINYPKDFEMAELFYNINNLEVNNKLLLLDCTLRDGGCANSFNFGSSDMEKIKTGLEEVGVDIIEVGYISDKGSEFNRTQFIDDKAVNNFIKDKKNNITYVAMIDYNTFDFNKLGDRSENTIDGIRLAFHKKDLDEALKCIEIISKKGYDVYIQPMVIINYSEEELTKLVEFINQSPSNIKALYIVDSFGQMYPENVRKLFKYIDSNLKEDVMLGFHGHNNRQMAYANSLEFINMPTDRYKMIDSSLDGMGKGAGNVPTELLISYINRKLNKDYNIDKAYEIINEVIKEYTKEYKWGYEQKYLLSANHGCTPSHVNYFIENFNVNLKELNILLGMLDSSKKIASDKEHCNQVYKKYKGVSND